MVSIDRKIARRSVSLNAICPYYTMYPLDFPLHVLSNASTTDRVLDPFCGRGTTNFASRLLGIWSAGIDSNPVATAVSSSKLCRTSSDAIIKLSCDIAKNANEACDIPKGEFWTWAFHDKVLNEICKFREELLRDCSSAERVALRAIMLGALHGPQPKTKNSYFSNQSPRTFSPKPAYALRYWKRYGLRPRVVDILAVIKERAQRYFREDPGDSGGIVVHGDSRDQNSFRSIDKCIKWVVTSPPYYGMKTYLEDQWLRSWFLGGAPRVPYRAGVQLEHSSPGAFAKDLQRVWANSQDVCVDGARLVIRFGAINARQVPPLEVIAESLRGTDWRIREIRPAGTADSGNRQAQYFLGKSSRVALEEYDITAELE